MGRSVLWPCGLCLIGLEDASVPAGASEKDRELPARLPELLVAVSLSTPVRSLRDPGDIRTALFRIVVVVGSS